MTRIFCTLLGLLFLLEGCRSPEKLLNAGRYDEAIYVAAKRLRGKNKNPKYVGALQRALEKGNRYDLDEAERLKKEGSPDLWDEINLHYSAIRDRQRIVEPLLPLVDKNGRRADIRLVNVDDEERESRQKAAEFLYASAEKLLREAEAGDRFKAREAYGNLLSLEQQYFRVYRDKENLKSRALQLGTTRVAFRMVNNARVIMPADFERALLTMNVSDLNKDWVWYDLNPDPAKYNYHYKVAMSLTRIDFTPEQANTREYQEEKEIQDGFEYEYDRNGNVKKDSLGRDIKRPRMLKVTAKVIESRQFKAAQLAGNLEYYDANNRLLKTLPVQVESVFEHFACTFVGDKRALAEETVKRLGNRPLPFPPNETLLLQAADRLKPVVVQQMVGNRSVIQ
jgi:hypothetical protein